ncbi:MAG TPA: DUF1638 domain-containing protein [Oceanipulchritudo sp.]|nr:DUF1638 domain-containing protein [Oceanipulchritudo sp.]
MSGSPDISFGILACDVLEYEVLARVNSLGLQPLALRFLPMGQHDYPSLLRENLQKAVTEMEEAGCRRIIFVYGLCSNSILGITARQAELVFPRAHDCITLFLGSKERYSAIQKAEPGTYWFSPGWCRGKRVPGPDHMTRLEAEYREKFDDEEDVEYLMEVEREKYAHYKVAAYTDLGDGPVEESIKDTRVAADFFGMEFVHHEGDDSLLRELLTGPWDDERYLVVPPGQTAASTADVSIIRCAACKSCQGTDSVSGS